MTHDETIIRLDELLAAELSPSEEREVRAHLVECAECREELAWLQTLREEVRALPVGVAPPRELWGGIADRLTPRGGAELPRLPIAGEIRPAVEIATETEVPGVIPLRPRPPRRPRWPLAAAALIAVALGSSTLTYVLVRPGTPVALAPPAEGVATPEARPRTALAAFAPAETEYRRAVDELTSVLATQRDRLAPETVATLESNLAIIDEAIRQSRAALEADPNSAQIARMLTHAYDAKVETLRQAVSL